MKLSQLRTLVFQPIFCKDLRKTLFEQQKTSSGIKPVSELWHKVSEFVQKRSVTRCDTV